MTQQRADFNYVFNYGKLWNSSYICNYVYKWIFVLVEDNSSLRFVLFIENNDINHILKSIYTHYLSYK